MVPADINNGMGMDIFLAFAFPALLFWAGVFLAKPKLSIMALLSGTFGLGLAQLAQALLGWFGVAITQTEFFIAFHFCTVITLVIVVPFFYLRTIAASSNEDSQSR